MSKTTGHGVGIERTEDNGGPLRRRHRSALAAAVLMLAVLVGVSADPVSAQGTHVIVNEGESIQAAIDSAGPGSTIIVKGDHVENIVITVDDIKLFGRNATLTMPENPAPAPEPCQPEPGVEALICVIPAGTTFAVPPTTRIDSVLITGFTLNNPRYDAINIAWTDHVRVRDNVIPAPGCDGIFTIFGTDVQVDRNQVTDAGCGGINVNASSHVRIQRNETNGSMGTGINAGDSTNTVIHKNSASGNCIGISAADGFDFGYGVQAEDFPGDNLRISQNVTNANNRLCPFGPVTVGGTGIVVGGVSDARIWGNTANDNVVDGESFTAGGILLVDFPNGEGPDGQSIPESVGNNGIVRHNTATGNSSAAGPVDVIIGSSGSDIRAYGNACDVAVPDAAACR